MISIAITDDLLFIQNQFLLWISWLKQVSEEVKTKNICLILSSPELGVQVSFSDHPSYVVLPFVRVSVCKLFTFSSFPPEPLGKFHQTWHKVFLSKGYSAYFKRWTTPFSKGEIITK